MNRVIKKFTASTIAVMLMIGVVMPAGQAQAATAAELQAMINALMAQIAAQQSTGIPPQTPTPVGVPVGKVGGVAGKFASFVQAEEDLEVGETGDLLTGKIKPAKFDRNLNKVVLYVSPGAGNDVEEPWVAFDDVELVVNGYGVRSVDVGNSAQWTKVATKSGVAVYAVTVYEGNIKLPAKSAHAFGATVDVSEGGNGDTWKMWIPKNGITVWSQQTQHVSYGPSRSFEYEVTTDVETEVPLAINYLDDEADAIVFDRGSVGEFAVSFEVTAGDQAVWFKRTPQASGQKSTGVQYVIDGPSDGQVAATLLSTGEQEGEYYVVREGESEEFELVVTVTPAVAGLYRVGVIGLQYAYAPSETNMQVLQLSASDARGFRTDPLLLMTTATTTPVSSVVASVDAFTASPVVVPSGKNGTLPVTLSWKSTGTSGCTLYNDPASEATGPIIIGAGLPSTGSLKVTPVWSKTEMTIAKQYRVICQAVSPAGGQVVARVVDVKLAAATSTPKATTTPAVKPTPRFNGIQYPAGTPKVVVSAVFAAPPVALGVTGPVQLGKVNWGDGTDSVSVSGVVKGAQVIVPLQHTYKKPGTYQITLTNLDGKTATASVKANFTATSTASSSGAVLGASIDVYSQMSAILVGIQEVINLMK